MSRPSFIVDKKKPDLADTVTVTVAEAEADNAQVDIHQIVMDISDIREVSAKAMELIAEYRKKSKSSDQNDEV